MCVKVLYCVEVPTHVRIMCQTRCKPPTPEAEPSVPYLVCRRALDEAASIFSLAWPQSVASLTAFSPRLFLLAAVGHLPNGAVLVGAAGIGNMYANFSQLMLIRSSTFGATPLLSQAFGAGNHHRVGVVLMRVLALHTCVVICFSLPLTAAAGPLLVAVGQSTTLADHAQTFLWLRFIGLPGVVIATDISTFLNAQRQVRLPMVINALGSVIQILLCIWLTSQLGFVGAPLAMTMVELLQAIMFLVLTPIVLKIQRIRSWPRWREAKQALRGWGEITSKGAPAALMVTSEWFGWECSLFIASALCSSVAFQPPTDLFLQELNASFAPSPPVLPHPMADRCAVVEAIPICTSVLVSQFILVFGVPLAMSNRVGNLLGAGQHEAAKYCSRIAFLMTLMGASTLAAAVISLRQRLATLIVDDPDINAVVSGLIPFTSTYSMIASLGPGWSQQLLFGLGVRLRVPAVINFVSLFIIGLPSGSLLAYQAHLGVHGLWSGLILAIACIVVGQSTFIHLAVDWAQTASIARQKALEKDAHSSTGNGRFTGEQGEDNDAIGLANADSAKAQSELNEM